MNILASLTRAEATHVAVELVNKSVSYLQAEKVVLTILRECAKWKQFNWTKIKDFVDTQYVKQVNKEIKQFKQDVKNGEFSEQF